MSSVSEASPLVREGLLEKTENSSLTSEESILYFTRQKAGEVQDKKRLNTTFRMRVNVVK